MQQEMFAV